MTEVINVEPLSPFENPTVLTLSSNQSVPTNARYTIRVTSTDPTWILTVPTGASHRIQNEGSNEFRVAFQPAGVFALTAGSEIEVNWNSGNNSHETQVVASTTYDNTVTNTSSNAPKSSAVFSHVATKVAEASGTPLVDNLAAIRVYASTPERIIARGHTSANDGGGGIFRRVAASGSIAGDDDNGWHVRHTATGALYAREGNVATPEMFGAFGAATEAAAAAASTQHVAMQKFADFCFQHKDFTGWNYHPRDPFPSFEVPYGYYRCDEPITLTIDIDADWNESTYPAEFKMIGAVWTPRTVSVEGIICDMHRNDGKSKVKLRAVKQRAVDGKVMWNADPWPDLYRDPEAYQPWAATTQVFVDEEIKHTIASGETVLYQVTAAGITGASGPTHSTGSAASGTATLLAIGTMTNAAGRNCNQLIARTRDIGILVRRCWEHKHGIEVEAFGYTIGCALIPRTGEVNGASGWVEMNAGQIIGCKFGIVLASYLYDEGVANQAARLALTGLPVGYKVRQADDATNDYVFAGPLGGEATNGNWTVIAQDASINWVNENFIRTGLIYARGTGSLISTNKSVYGCIVTDFNADYHPSGNYIEHLNCERADGTGNAETVQIVFYAGTENKATGRNDAETKNRAMVSCRRSTRALEPSRNTIEVSRGGQLWTDTDWRQDRTNGRLNLVYQPPGPVHERTKRWEVNSLLDDVVFSGVGGDQLYFRRSTIYRTSTATAQIKANYGVNEWLFRADTRSFTIPFGWAPMTMVEIPDNHTGDAMIEIEVSFASTDGTFRPILIHVNPVTGAVGEQITRSRQPINGEPYALSQLFANPRYYFRTSGDYRTTMYFFCEPWVKKLLVGFYGDYVTGYRIELHRARNGRVYSPAQELVKAPGPITGAIPQFGIFRAPTRLWYEDQSGVNKGAFLNKGTADVEYWATSGPTSGIGSPVSHQWGHDNATQGSRTVQYWDGSAWQTIATNATTIEASDWTAF